MAKEDPQSPQPVVQDIQEDAPPVVSLDEATRMVAGADRSISDLDLQRFRHARNISSWIVGMQIFTTLVVAGLVVYFAQVDADLIKAGIISPDSRFVTEGVLMALIAATFTQIGASTYLIVKYLFGPADQPASD